MENIIKVETTKQVGKFAIVGVINTLVDVVILNILVYLGFTAVFIIFQQEFLIANVISVAVAIINSFILNKFWTFQANGESLYLQIIKFLVITIIGMFVFHQLIFNGIYYGLPWISEFAVSIVHFLRLNSIFSDQFIALNFSKAIAIAASLIWNFIGYKFIVFKR